MESDDELAFELRMACMRLARRVRYATDSPPPHWFGALAKLADGVTTASELAARERVSAPSMSRTLCELRERGFIDRSPDPDDGRRQRLELTESGQEAIRQERRRRNAWTAQRLEHLTAEQRAVLAEATVLINMMLEDIE